MTFPGTGRTAVVVDPRLRDGDRTTGSDLVTPVVE
jgi:hypothetical protein